MRGKRSVRWRPSLLAMRIQCVWDKVVVEAKNEGPIAHAAGKAQSIGRVAGHEHAMARRADNMTAWSIMLGEKAGNRKDDNVIVSLLNLATGVGRRPHLECTNDYGVTLKERLASHLHRRAHKTA